VSENGFAHLHPAMRRVAEYDDDRRIQRLKLPRWIEHPEATKVLEIIAEALDQPPSDRADNILLIAESGMGKTMLLNTFQRRQRSIPGTEADPGTKPVVVVTMPHKPTEKAFFLGLLLAMTAPHVSLNHLNTLSLSEMTLRRLKMLDTRMLVIDEINSLQVGSPKEQRLFLQLLRSLSNDLGLVLVCSGVPEARHAFFSDTQLSRRFSEVELPLWTMGPAFQAFVIKLVQSMPLRLPSPVESDQVCKLLIDRSEGITSYVRRAIMRAAMKAIRDGSEMINLESLRDDRIWHGKIISRASMPHFAAGRSVLGAG
jgi:hypothetical protein